MVAAVIVVVRHTSCWMASAAAQHVEYWCRLREGSWAKHYMQHYQERRYT